MTIWALENDRELIPNFVLEFKQLNFKDRIIKVTTTKTARNPRHQVPMEDNILAWLIGF